jgi:dethiobiotin synthetase
MRGVFVTGTDTNVGKTIVCAALMHRYRKDFPVRYWKPVQTGIEEQDDTAEVRRLAECEDHEILDQGVRLKHPASPHLAAELEGETIELARVCRIPRNQTRNSCWIVEGAGGVLVPLNKRDLMISLMKVLGLPVVVVARTELGTINHTLLTIEALRTREMPIAGIILVGQPRLGTRTAIEQHSNAVVLGEMPHFAELTVQTLARWAIKHLDPRDHIAKYLNWQLAKHDAGRRTD